MDRDTEISRRRLAGAWIAGVVLAIVGAGEATAGQSVLPRYDENVQARALRQIREQRGLNTEMRYVQIGEGRVLCGYVGRRGEAAAVAFVSRPSRILFSDDPLQVEFRETRDRFCPDLPRAPGPRAG